MSFKCNLNYYYLYPKILNSSAVGVKSDLIRGSGDKKKF